MLRVRTALAVLLLVLVPALAAAQDAPLTPAIVGAGEEDVVRTWGEPSSRTQGTHPHVGSYVAWHYASLPWPDGDPPGQRTLSVLVQDERVIGAAVLGTALEPIEDAGKRVERRTAWMRERLEEPEAAFRGFVRWVNDREQWLVAYRSQTSHEEIPEDKARFTSVVGSVDVAAMLYVGAFN